MYNKQVWKDEIPDLARPILDGSGKQKTDPQTGRPLFELVQEGTRITSTRLNTMEGGIEAAHTLVEQLAKELGGNFVAVINGVMGLQCSAQGLTVTWTAGVAYVGGRRFEVSAGNMPLNPTQGQYLYVDTDGIVKKTTSQATAKAGVLLFYVATDSSGVISSTDQRVNISLEEILMKLENIDVPEASLTEKGIVQLSNATNGTRENVAATEKAVKDAYDRGSAGINAAAAAQARADAAFTQANDGKGKVRTAIIGEKGTVEDADGDGIPTFDELAAGVKTILPNATADAVLDPNMLVVGYSGYDDGVKKAGQMPNRSAENHHMPGLEATVWAGDRFFIKPPRGFFDGESWVTAPVPWLVPNNIRAGVNASGVDGTLQEGVKYATGTIGIIYAQNSQPIDCGFVPKVFVVSGLVQGFDSRASTYIYQTADGIDRTDAYGGTYIYIVTRTMQQVMTVRANNADRYVQNVIWQAWG
ncbi:MULTISPECIES: phage tail protein [Paenibacillus]|uniref:phage tail protein n=1 Tax=Paenibacillus TaxID=44249 RepID=UPI00240DAEBF|nr:MULTISPECIES: phage tail protein [Paenibacillus]MCI1776586.1 phage tail protein [Paenibacillus lautus]WFB57585.1 phage tail protein [Paenibacillus sp. BR1-192]